MKIAHNYSIMKINYKIKEVRPNVFAVIIKDDYDRAMTFCRVQEFYESPNKKFRGKDFSIWDYMKWYSSEYKRGFSYGVDWSGFNIPYDVIEKCYDLQVMSETPYDDEMYYIFNKISDMKKDGKAYIIGADSLDSDTFNHEICHGLYYTNNQYKQLVNEITLTIPTKNYSVFQKNLIDMGYTESVVEDEIQAYLTTNWNYQRFRGGVSKQDCKELHNEYKKVFKSF